MKLWSACSALALGLAAATGASATVFSFSVHSTIQDNGNYSYVPNYEFQIDDAAVVDNGDSTFTAFNIITTGHRPSLGIPQGDETYAVDYQFYPDVYGGAFNEYFGDQLFTIDGDGGFHFTAGNYDLYDGSSDGPAATLVISSDGSVPSPTPEPASWALMLAGFGATGMALRARRRTVAFA